MPNFGQGGFSQGVYGGPPVTKLPYEVYRSLVISQYASSPKFMAFLSTVIGLIDNVTDCIASFDNNFTLGSAVGAQLDVIGTLVGASRTVPFQPSNGVSPVLDDATYRIYLTAKIGSNFWDGTADGLQALWKSIFPSGTIVIQDQMDMTADVILTGSFTSIIIDLINNGFIVPRPAGVLYNIIVGSDLPLFGTDLNNTYIAGFDTGHFA